MMEEVFDYEVENAKNEIKEVETWDVPKSLKWQMGEDGRVHLVPFSWVTKDINYFARRFYGSKISRKKKR